MSAAADGCGAPAGGVAVSAASDAGSQAIIEGTVTHAGSVVTVGYARLLNGDGEFVAEVPLGSAGDFRFFAAPGSWTVRILAPGELRAERQVTAATGRITSVPVDA